MTARTHTRFLRRLSVFSEFYSSRLAPGNPKRARFRHGLVCCGTSLCNRTVAPASVYSTVTPSRHFINLSASICPRRIELSHSKKFGYSPEQMYDIVANVDEYSQFVPWCKKSRLMKGRNGEVRAELEVGFPPVLERYISELTYVPNHQVQAVCRDGRLFRHLETVWRFSPGPAKNSCNVEFYVSFEFKSLFHSQLAKVFFEDVAKEVIRAFESRAAVLYRNHPAKSVKKPS